MSEVKEKSFVGYKGVIKIGSKFYSPVTGLMYEEGMDVPILEFNRVARDSAWIDIFSEKLKPMSSKYQEKMEGKTGVLVHESDAINIFKKYMLTSKHKYTIVKMTISGEMDEDKFNGYPTKLGSKILKIEELGY